MHWRIATVLFVLPALAGPSVARAAFVYSAPEATRLARPVVVAAAVEDRMFIVPVMINGVGPLRMLVDTGASLTVLSPRTAAAVGAVEITEGPPALRAFNAFNRQTHVRETRLDTLQIGAAHFDGVPAVVTDELDAMGRISGRAVDGIIGFSVFADVVAAMDFPRQELRLSAAFPEDLPAVRHRQDLSVINDVPVISARIDTIEFDLVMDTGANGGLSLPAEWTRTLPWESAPRPGRLVKVLGEIDREAIGRLGADVRLGRVELARPVAALHDGNPSIGTALLEGFCVVFDIRGDAVWLCATADGPVVTPPVRTIGLSLIPESAGWRVAGIVPGSPAESAGIAVGDTVTTIEGSPATDWSRSRLDDWIQANAATRLEVVRGAVARSLQLASWNLVP